MLDDQILENGVRVFLEHVINQSYGQKNVCIDCLDKKQSTPIREIAKEFIEVSEVFETRSSGDRGWSCENCFP